MTKGHEAVRRAGLAVLASALCATSLSAQQLSPRLARVRPDSSVLVWLIARPGTDLDRLAADAAALGRVRHISRFVGAVSVVAPLRSLRGLRGVQRVQPVGAFFRRPETADRPPARPALSVGGVQVPVPGDSIYGPLAWAMNQLNILALHNRGLRGAGVRIAVLDAGFNTAHPLMAGATIIAERDFVYGDSVVRDQPGEAAGEMRHGTAVWSLLAARVPGTLYGVAPDAEYLLAKTEFTQTETRTEEDNWVAAIEWAVGLGAHIVSSSLGYLSFDNGFSYTRDQLSGDFAVTTIAADSAARRGVLVVVSAGNEGFQPGSIVTPADADSVVSVGAVDSLGTLAAFSSRGPTGDGRIKPEVVAAGVQVPAAGIDSGVVPVSGTSLATPLVAGLAALVHGLRPAEAAVALRTGLMHAGSNALAPNNAVGWGIPRALHFYAFPAGLTITGPANGVSPTVTPTFSWNAGTPPPDAGPNVYLLRVAADSLMSTLLLDTFTTNPSLAVGRPFPGGTRLWWRVVASSTLGVVESTTVQGPVRIPEWVTLLTLANPAGASIRDSLPLLVWSAPQVSSPPGPFTFDVDVYPASRTPDRAVASARGLTATVFVPPAPLERNLPFRWRVVARLGNDSQVVTSPGTFLVLDETVPSATLLFQNFPNPFPSTVTSQLTTCLWFDLAVSGPVRLEVYDLRGRLVRRIAPSATVPATLAAGRYGRPTGGALGTCDPRFSWDGRDDSGDYTRPGVYVARLSTTGIQDSRRIVWLGR